MPRDFCQNLVGDKEDLARIRFRRDGERRWRSFVVVLDDETTYETVIENAEQLIGLYCGRAAP